MQQPVFATHRRRLALAGALALVAGAGLAAWLLLPQTPAVAGGGAALAAGGQAAQAAGDLAALPAGTAGMRVALQPETGDLEMPSPEQMQALGAGFGAKARGDLVLRSRADGGLTVDVRGHFLSYSVAHRHADGTLVHDCVAEPQLHGHLGGSPVPAAGSAVLLPVAAPAPQIGEVQ